MYFYKTTRRYITEDSTFPSHRCMNLRHNKDITKASILPVEFEYSLSIRTQNNLIKFVFFKRCLLCGETKPLHLKGRKSRYARFLSNTEVNSVGKIAKNSFGRNYYWNDEQNICCFLLSMNPIPFQKTYFITQYGCYIAMSHYCTCPLLYVAETLTCV